ncbi:hypothetical protein FGADI_7769 [Fusarium gaditjirri]|uniref:Uncharacterized protein n=1 Tax=Fusarium gaditjirri TaxID=282569 RepID=A0A8H4WUM8_9HYPO|nr:hypothetical protein FGADI_7769 [Fusarium gaditjirri]
MYILQDKVLDAIRLGKEVLHLLPFVNTTVLDHNYQHLETSCPEIASKDKKLREEVNTPISNSGLDGYREQALQQCQESTEALSACIEEIRIMEGQERFMLGQTMAEMKEGAAEGIIVVVNITDYKSDAILT